MNGRKKIMNWNTFNEWNEGMNVWNGRKLMTGKNEGMSWNEVNEWKEGCMNWNKVNEWKEGMYELEWS